VRSYVRARESGHFSHAAAAAPHDETMLFSDETTRACLLACRFSQAPLPRYDSSVPTACTIFLFFYCSRAPNIEIAVDKRNELLRATEHLDANHSDSTTLDDATGTPHEVSLSRAFYTYFHHHRCHPSFYPLFSPHCHQSSSPSASHRLDDLTRPVRLIPPTRRYTDRSILNTQERERDCQHGRASGSATIAKQRRRKIRRATSFSVAPRRNEARRYRFVKPRRTSSPEFKTLTTLRK